MDDWLFFLTHFKSTSFFGAHINKCKCLHWKREWRHVSDVNTLALSTFCFFFSPPLLVDTLLPLPTLHTEYNVMWHIF